VTDTVVWIGVAIAAVAAMRMAEPYHTRLIAKVHERLAAESRDLSKR
jgi:hypothetical protein